MSRKAAVSGGASENRSVTEPGSWRARRVRTRIAGPQASRMKSSPQPPWLSRSGEITRMVTAGPAKPLQARTAHKAVRRSSVSARPPTPNSRVRPAAAVGSQA